MYINCYMYSRYYLIKKTWVTCMYTNFEVITSI